MNTTPQSLPLRVAGRVFAIAMVGLTIAASALCTLLIMQAGRILPGISIDGVDLSGMTRADAQVAFAAAHPDEREQVATVTLDGTTHTLRADDADVVLDIPASINAAYMVGRNSVSAVLGRPLRIFQSREVPARYQFSAEVIHQFVADIAKTHDQDVVHGMLAVRARAPFVVAEIPQFGIAVDQPATTQVVIAQLTGITDGPVAVPHARTRPRMSRAHVRALTAALTTVLSTPPDVRVETTPVAFTTAQLAALITVHEEPSPVGVIPRITVAPDVLPSRLYTAANGHVRSPEPERFSSPQQPERRLTALGDVTVEPIPYPVFVVPPIDGLIVDAEGLAEQFVTAFTNGQSQIRLTLRPLPPPEARLPLEEITPTHLLATFTSPLIADQARNINITKLAETLDDRIILPGEQFSINDISGPRLCADGYVPAGTIVAGELVDACGGGVSQVGTTVLNAAFFAGVQLDAFTPHSFYISRYAPGREATLSYPRLDVAFTNTTPAALHLRAFTTATSLTVSLYGQPQHRAVAARHGPQTDPRSFREERRLDTSLPRGTEQVLQAGGSGFTITVTRIITLIDGREVSEQFTTRYLPQRRIVTYNPAPAPAPNPEPDPEPIPSPADGPAAALQHSSDATLVVR